MEFLLIPLPWVIVWISCLCRTTLAVSTRASMMMMVAWPLSTILGVSSSVVLWHGVASLVASPHHQTRPSLARHVSSRLSSIGQRFCLQLNIEARVGVCARWGHHCTSRGGRCVAVRNNDEAGGTGLGVQYWVLIGWMIVTRLNTELWLVEPQFQDQILSKYSTSDDPKLTWNRKEQM